MEAGCIAETVLAGLTSEGEGCGVETRSGLVEDSRECCGWIASKSFGL